MDSGDSKIYPGLKGAYKRGVAVYVPNGYVPDTAAPFIVVQDAMCKGSLPKILDNMIAERRLPPMIAIFITSAAATAKAVSEGWNTTPCREPMRNLLRRKCCPGSKRITK